MSGSHLSPTSVHGGLPASGSNTSRQSHPKHVEVQQSLSQMFVPLGFVQPGQRSRSSSNAEDFTGIGSGGGGGGGGIRVPQPFGHTIDEHSAVIPDPEP